MSPELRKLYEKLLEEAENYGHAVAESRDNGRYGYCPKEADAYDIAQKEFEAALLQALTSKE